MIAEHLLTLPQSPYAAFSPPVSVFFPCVSCPVALPVMPASNENISPHLGCCPSIHKTTSVASSPPSPPPQQLLHHVSSLVPTSLSSTASHLDCLRINPRPLRTHRRAIRSLPTAHIHHRHSSNLLLLTLLLLLSHLMDSRRLRAMDDLLHSSHMELQARNILSNRSMYISYLPGTNIAS